MTLGRIDTQFICLFAFHSGACLLTGVIKFAHTHITYMLVLELAQFISLETELCLLRDLDATNNGFEHVLYPLLKSACNI